MTQTARRLAGRDAELKLLRGLIADLTLGRGRSVWVEGEPGIGKSALLATALADADNSGVRVFRAFGDDLVPAFSLTFLANGLLVGEADEFRSEIVDLLAGRGSGLNPVVAARQRIVALVERECARSPVILVADDVQIADEASLATCLDLVKVTEQAPLLLIAACRPIPQRVEVDRLRSVVLHRPGSVVLSLEALHDEDVAKVAQTILGAAPGPALRRGLTTAGGNPLYVGELIDALVRQRLIRLADGVSELETPIGPELASVNEAIGRRLDFLSSATRSILRTAALLGARFTVYDLATMSACAVPELTVALGEAMAANVVTGAGNELAFRHDLIRQTLRSEIPQAIQVALHGHAARTFAESDVAWTRVARHLLAAPVNIDGWALDWLIAVPSEALLAQPVVAAQLLEGAEAATLPGDRRRSQIVARLSGVLRMLRRMDDLVTLATNELSMISDPALVGEITWHLARAYQTIPSGGKHALAAIDAALAGPDPGPPWRSRLRAQRALALFTVGRVEESQYEAQAIIDGYERDGEEQVGDAVSKAWAISALLKNAERAQWLEVLERGLAASAGTHPELVDVRFLFLANRLVILSNLDRFAEYEAALGPTLTMAEDIGTPRIAEIQRIAAKYFFIHGDWDQALLYCSQIEVLTPVHALWKHGLAARIYAHTGNDAVAAQLRALENVPYTTDVDNIIAAADLIVARAVSAEAQGDLPQALDTLAIWLDARIVASSATRQIALYYLPVLIRVALALGDGAIARAACQAAMMVQEDSPGDESYSVAGLCRGMIDDEPSLILAACEFFRRSRHPRETGFAAEEAAVRLAMHGDLAGARAAFADAVAQYEQLPATVDLRRVLARMRQLGVRAGSRTPRRRAVTGWESLTAAERHIAELVKQGLSNPEIASRSYLSRRTVETHVSHILRKLQIQARIDIARVMAPDNLAEPVKSHGT